MGNNDQWMPWYERMATMDSEAERNAYLRGQFAPAQPSAGQVAGAAATAGLMWFGIGQMKQGFGKKKAQREAQRQEEEEWAVWASQVDVYVANRYEELAIMGDLLEEWGEHDSARAKAYNRYLTYWEDVQAKLRHAFGSRDPNAVNAVTDQDAVHYNRLLGLFYEN